VLLEAKRAARLSGWRARLFRRWGRRWRDGLPAPAFDADFQGIVFVGERFTPPAPFFGISVAAFEGKIREVIYLQQNENDKPFRSLCLWSTAQPAGLTCGF
jgi:hypothetical protein